WTTTAPVVTVAQGDPRTGRHRTPAARRGNPPIKDEPGYCQLLHARSGRPVSTSVVDVSPRGFEPTGVASPARRYPVAVSDESDQAARARTTVLSCRHSEHLPEVI